MDDDLVEITISGKEGFKSEEWLHAIRLLSSEQRAQVEMQWKEQQHETHKVDIELSPGLTILEDFSVHAGVWNPAIVSAGYHAAYLVFNNSRLYAEETAFDIGTGTGLMGIVMALHGAENVIMSDISLKAYENAQVNVHKYGLGDVISVVHGDLFENIQGKAKFISFMQPYFNGTPKFGDSISRSMLTSSNLIKRFLREAKDYLETDGVILMPGYSLAGNGNNPKVLGEKQGYNVQTVFSVNCNYGLQKGELLLYELRLK